MERTATHDTEYVDIVLGYRHILLFSLVFGAVIFGTGYFAGYQRGQDAQGPRATVAAPDRDPAQATPGAPLPPVQVPAMLTEPQATKSGDVLKEVEELSQESLVPKDGSADPAAATAPSTAVSPADPAASDAEEQPEEQAPPAARRSAPPAPPAEKPAAKPRASSSRHYNRPGVYLQVSSFDAAQDADKLIDELAAEGFRALVDGQLIGGKHTVLVGPFEDFKTAVGRAKELRRKNREAFPIRR